MEAAVSAGSRHQSMFASCVTEQDYAMVNPLTKACKQSIVWLKQSPHGFPHLENCVFNQQWNPIHAIHVYVKGGRKKINLLQLLTTILETNNFSSWRKMGQINSVDIDRGCSCEHTVFQKGVKSCRHDVSPIKMYSQGRNHF